ncbi:permease prefix domain 1-containing protein [Paenibacillus xylanexedens]|uniref:permease prefix domain 1-containing protein n=1 Tax=Paenibacillus xylanexedens TaxID=528191 RepID=UPI0011A72ADD|nr:permease prefix domain 1-containing protein [Paenibacillus xylanexedens]
MNLEERISRHMERLFEHAQDTTANRELKEEIHSNLAARMEDYIDQGMSEEQAFDKAIQHIAGLDQIMSDQHQVQRFPYWTAVLQSALIYCLIAWIITIPMRVLMEGKIVNFWLMIASAIVGGAYLLYMWSNRERQRNAEATTVIRSTTLRKWTRIAWWMWGALILVLWSTQAALRFGSNIWYSRPVLVEGPYQFVVLVIAFVIPLLTIIVPLIVQKAGRLVREFEVGEIRG